MKLTEEEFQYLEDSSSQEIDSPTVATSHKEEEKENETLGLQELKEPMPTFSEGMESNGAEPHVSSTVSTSSQEELDQDIEVSSSMDDIDRDDKNDSLSQNLTASEQPYFHQLKDGMSAGEKSDAVKGASKRRHSALKLSNWLNGNILRPFLNKRYIYLTLEIVFLFFIYISMGLHRIEKVNRIDRLEDKLRQLEYRQLFIMGELGKLDREETVLQKLQESGSALIPDNDPPFVIYYNGKEFTKEQKDNYSAPRK